MNIHNNCLHVITPTIATFIGQNESILLNQILYWISKCGRKIAGQEGKWIYNSLAKWHKQFSYWSMYKLRKTIKSLEDLSLIKSIKVNAKRWNHTKWYTVNHSEYNKLLEKLKTKKHNIVSSLPGKFNKRIFIEKNVANENSKFTPKSKGKFSTNRFVENQQIIITKNNHTNNISSINKKKVKITDSETTKKLLQNNKKMKKVANEMKEIWDKIFSYSLNPIKAYLNIRIIEKLERIKREKFNDSLVEWEEYVKKINTSKFLMGEKKTKNNFKAVFPWLIKEETINSIQQGAYGVGDRELDINNLDENIKNKECEIKIEIDKKIFQFLENTIDKKREEKEFKKYLLNQEYEKDNDKYKVEEYMKKVSKYQVYGFYITPRHFYYVGNERLKEQIFYSYLMSKYLGIDKLSMKEKIKKISKGEQNKYTVFVRLSNIINNVKNISCHHMSDSNLIFNLN